MIGKIRLPIVEENIEITEGRESTEVKILNGKTVTVMGNKKLIEISYSSYFPKNYSPACDISSIKSPMKYVGMIEKILNGDNYARVNIPKKKINKLFSITSWTWKPRANGDIDYSIELKEFNKPQENNVIAIPTATASSEATVTAFSGSLNGEARETKTVEPTTYTVQAGDYLCAIARAFNMDWRDLYNDNKDVIGNDPNAITPGTILKVRGTSETTKQNIDKVNNTSNSKFIKNEKGTIIGRR